MSTIFTGSAVAIVTPMNADKTVNFGKLEELIDFQIDGGTDCILICGTTGEASTLTDEEHLECIRVAVSRTNKRVPVMAGTGSNHTDHAIELSKKAEIIGVDALLHVNPYYNKATQNGLVRHFTDIATSVDVPIMLYNVPSRTGLNILPSTVLELSKVDNIVAMKEASGNIAQVVELAAITEGAIDIYSGNDDQILPILSLGGKGVVSVIANMLPTQTHDIVANFMKGDVATSTALQLKYHDLIGSLFCEVNPIPIKAAMNLMGMNVGPTRRPLYEMEAANLERLRQSMINVGVALK